MTTLRGRAARAMGVWSAVLLATCVVILGLGAGVAGAAGTTDPTGAIELGGNEPTTTIVVDGTPIELIPAASAELPPEATDGAVAATTTASPAAATAEAAATSAATQTGADATGAEIEVRGVSAQAGPTAPEGAGSSMGTIWIVIAAVVILGSAAVLTVRWRRAANH